MNHWSGIQHDINLFAGCLSKIEARNFSGWTVDDKIANACAMFKADDKHHRNFPFIHCWNILKDKLKWMDRRKHMSTPKTVAKKQRTTTNSSPSSTPLSITAVRRCTGETGKKKEKQKLWQRSSMEAIEYLVTKKEEAAAEKDLKKEERCKKAFALQEERIKIEKEKVQFKRELEEERIMNIDMSTLSYKQQQYYERRQDEILARRVNN